MKSPIEELKEASEAVISVAAHPNRPSGVIASDRLKIARLRRAVLMVVMGAARHSPAPMAPRVSKPKVQTG